MIEPLLILRYNGLIPKYKLLLGFQNLIRVYNLLLIPQDHLLVISSMLIYIVMVTRTDVDKQKSSFAASSLLLFLQYYNGFTSGFH